MIAISCIGFIAMLYIPVGIEGQPLDLEIAYLEYSTHQITDSVAVSSSPDSSDAVLTNFAEFPALFNSAKAWAAYNDSTRVLTVTSEYPGSSIRAIAEYHLDFDANLTLVNFGVLDQYAVHLGLMKQAALEGDFERAIGEVYEMWYPGNCTYKAEMGIVFLYALINEIDKKVSQESTTDELYSLQQMAYESARYIFLPDLHSMILEPDRYPEMGIVELPEYIQLLKRYASLLYLLNNQSERESVLETIHILTV